METYLGKVVLFSDSRCCAIVKEVGECAVGVLLPSGKVHFLQKMALEGVVGHPLFDFHFRAPMPTA